MLLEFSVENFKSFASEQSLSLVASGLSDGHQDRIAIVEGAQTLQVLTSAIIMGKNGSGKSSLVEAMRFCRDFILSSAAEGQQGQAIATVFHRLDPALSNGSSSFRILFSMNKNIYQYSFTVTSTHVTYENLEISDKTQRFRKMFSREYIASDERYDYSFGEALRGDKTTWKSATRSNSLFLSTANQLNSESLREPFDWFMTYFRSVDAVGNGFTNYTSRQCQNSTNKRNVIEFLRALDIDVHDIKIEEEEVLETLTSALNSDFLSRLVKSDPNFSRLQRVKFIHKGANDSHTALDIAEESTGTRALFGLAGPMFDSLAHGYCLVIDEINTSLHPLVLHRLIELFSNPKINKKRAQLVFTSHDTSILKDSYFRRDQIWFVDKESDGKSNIVPLSDYTPRKGEALDRGYLGGRYGGVPFIGPIEPLVEAETLWEPIA